MDISKFYDFFKPENCKSRIHIIGCGAVGSTIAELLVRMGLNKITLYDYDIVEGHNIANQIYRSIDIGKTKEEALKNILQEIDPDVDIKTAGKYVGQPLNGYVFLAVDSIALRKKICNDNLYNSAIKAMFDTRIRLTDAQGYAAVWSSYDDKQNLLNSMDFTDEEADRETPVTACNLKLSVAPTVRIISNYIVCNFLNLLLDNMNNFKKLILVDAFSFNTHAF